jgi:hypothetical protein
MDNLAVDAAFGGGQRGLARGADRLIAIHADILALFGQTGADALDLGGGFADNHGLCRLELALTEIHDQTPPCGPRPPLA